LVRQNGPIEAAAAGDQVLVLHGLVSYRATTRGRQLADGSACDRQRLDEVAIENVDIGCIGRNARHVAG
jgi:hypothetical protein